MPIISLIQFRKGTAEEWTIANPILETGEPGLDLTNNHLKVGNGADDWQTLKPIGNTLNFGVYDIYTNITEDYTVSINDHIIFVDTSNGVVNITIPTAINLGGKQYIIKKIGGNADIIISCSEINETIDGESSLSIKYLYSSITLISNNSNWFII